MSSFIRVNGIETNNLKNIDIVLKKNSINLIIGPSGSGKSSLAYGTVAQIGQHEMTAISADGSVEPTYKVRSYENMIATVPVRQSNNNNNIRSTIGTYFNLNQSIALIYSVLLGVDETFFVLNKEDNLCPQCRGLGFLKGLDINRIIDYDVPLEKCPVKCWTRYRDFYSQIIIDFCIDKGIDYKKNFRMLNDEEKQAFLYGESEAKYSIRYKKTGMNSRRTTKFFGIMTGTAMIPKFVPAKQFFADQVCSLCHGNKYSQKHNEYKLHELSIGELMCTPFENMNKWLELLSKNTYESNLIFAISKVSSFVKKALSMNLGHLFFNRSIPTLSGGELQRLRLVQVFNTQLSDLLIVLDEPLAGLSGAERVAVYENVMELSKRHTMLVIDHHRAFVQTADVVVALGKYSGRNGGRLIDFKEYLKSQDIDLPYRPLAEDKTIHIVVESPVYEYKGADVWIAQGRLNVIAGKSGIGKSTLLREYMPQYLDRYIYINQKSLSGNKNSFVATVLDIFRYITENFANEFGKDKRFFSNLTGCEGACPYCLGAGYIDYGNDYRMKAQIECKECSGTGFNKNLRKYLLCGKSIFDIWSMTIDEAFEYYQNMDVRISRVLAEAMEIMLGHLLIGQPTTSLSGGENIRIKILKSANATSNVYGVDEPFKGLSRTEIYCMIKFMDRFVRKGKTVIVVDHEEESFRYFSKRIELTNQGGILTGVDFD